jgi:hypothetical protein
VASVVLFGSFVLPRGVQRWVRALVDVRRYRAGEPEPGRRSSALGDSLRSVTVPYRSTFTMRRFSPPKYASGSHTHSQHRLSAEDSDEEAKQVLTRLPLT